VYLSHSPGYGLEVYLSQSSALHLNAVRTTPTQAKHKSPNPNAGVNNGTGVGRGGRAGGRGRGDGAGAAAAGTGGTGGGGSSSASAEPQSSGLFAHRKSIISSVSASSAQVRPPTLTHTLHGGGGGGGTDVRVADVADTGGAVVLNSHFEAAAQHAHPTFTKTLSSGSLNSVSL
jgi:hypothetical protein